MVYNEKLLVNVLVKHVQTISTLKQLKPIVQKMREHLNAQCNFTNEKGNFPIFDQNRTADFSAQSGGNYGNKEGEKRE